MKFVGVSFIVREHLQPIFFIEYYHFQVGIDIKMRVYCVNLSLDLMFLLETSKLSTYRDRR